MMLFKMLEESSKLTVDVALAHSVSAKNSLQSYNGFSPIQFNWSQDHFPTFQMF